jgi:hypothetical protein
MKRPIPVTILAWLFIIGGFASTIYHLVKSPRDRWAFPISLVGIIAIVGGIFLLKGASWARWLLLVWLAFHVLISALNSLSQALPHFVLLVVIAYFLLTPPASDYFKSPNTR